jgi:NAD(P)-dependent dehydrogenase (short-subunit alcohol dehydrogenase family)
MDRAALITGGSSGIGLAIARVLGEEGYGLTLTADGLDVLAVPGNVTDEEAIKDVLAKHRERWGRLDVLINNAGLGIGAAVADTETKKLDLQLNVNLRAVYLVARDSIPMLKEAGAKHGKALMVNTASIAGKQGQAFLPAYSATKFGVVGLSQALHRELMGDGIQVTALCPGFVATPMTDWVEGQVPKEEMIQPEDIAESVRFLLNVSPACIVPEIQFFRRGDSQV